jgi:hypothetical protein
MKDQMIRKSLLVTLLISGTAATPASSWAARSDDDPCGEFSWNVTHERALFTETAKSEKAGGEKGTAPLIAPDHLYNLTLTHQSQVHFPVPPGKKPSSEDAFGGLARLRLKAAGLYRISVDRPFWVDVVAGDELIHSVDFQGAAGCTAPHKVVQFMLPASRELVLQISGLPVEHAYVTITTTPALQRQ